MKNIRFFLSENFPFLFVKFSVYLNRRVFAMMDPFNACYPIYQKYLHILIPYHTYSKFGQVHFASYSCV